MSRERKGLRTRAKILAEATRLFGKQGFDGVSLREIASAAGVSLAAVSTYFPKKIDLQEAVTIQAIHVVMDLIEDAMGSRGTPPERLYRFIESLIGIFENPRPEMELIDREFQNLYRPYIKEFLGKALTIRRSPIIGLLEQTGGSLPPGIPANRLSDLVFSLIYGAAKLRPVHSIYTGKEFVTKEALTRDIFTILMRIVCASESTTLAFEPDKLGSGPNSGVPATGL